MNKLEKAIQKRYESENIPAAYRVAKDFLENFGDNLDLELTPEYEYEEIEDPEGRRATHRHIKIGGRVSYKGKNR